MKAASGELNLTVITIIAIAAVIGFFTMFLLPRVTNSINDQFNDTIKKSITDQWNNIANQKVDPTTGKTK